MITSQLFEAYLSCRMKCFLLSAGTGEGGNPIAAWLEKRAAAYRAESLRAFQTRYEIEGDRLVAAQDLQARIHALQRIRRRGKELSVPLRFVTNERSRRALTDS